MHLRTGGNPGNLFKLDGNVVEVNDGANLDFAESPYYTITVVASDPSGASCAPVSFDIGPTLWGQEDGPDWTSVSQAYFQDCWFVAALVELAHDDPAGVKQMITYTNNWNPLDLQVQMCTSTGWTWVHVRLDQDLNWADYSDCNGIWVAAFEAAYADIGGELAPNEAGAAISPLTGDSEDGFDFWEEDEDGDYVYTMTPLELYQDLQDWRNNDDSTANGIVVTGCTHYSQAQLDAAGFSYVVAGHAYSVMSVDTEDGQPLVYLRNPWGWRDPSNFMGEFSMTLGDFMDVFTGLAYQVSDSDDGDSFTDLLDASPSTPALRFQHRECSWCFAARRRQFHQFSRRRCHYNWAYKLPQYVHVSFASPYGDRACAA